MTSFVLLCLIALAAGTDIHAQSGTPVIRDISFTGNGRFSARELKDAMALGLPARYDSAAVYNSLNGLIEFYRERGYLFAEIASLSLDIPADSDQSVLNVGIVEGNVCVFGDFFTGGEDSPLADEIAAFLPEPGTVFSRELLYRSLAEFVEETADAGYPYLNVSVKGAEFSRIEAERIAVDVIIGIGNARETTVDSVLVSGNDYTQSGVIVRESRLRKGSPLTPRALRRAREYLANLTYIAAVEPPAPYVYDEDRAAVKLEIEERRANRFSGLIGYVPGNNVQDGYYIGSFEIDLGNVLGTGRKFYAEWNRQDRSSQELGIMYEEPWVAGLPVNVYGRFDQALQDSTYIKRGFSAGAKYRLNSAITVELAAGIEQVIVEEAGETQYGLINSTGMLFTAGIEYINMDNRLNPRKGVYYRTHLTEQKRELSGEQEQGKSFRDRKIAALAEAAAPLSGNAVLFGRAAWNQTTTSSDEVPVPQQWYLGGARSLRGYREKQFLSPTVSWYNLELRYLLNRDSRIFIFNDAGFFTGSNADVVRKFGYGFGLRIQSRIGLMGFDLGFGEGDTFSDAKLHVQIRNSF